MQNGGKLGHSKYQENGLERWETKLANCEVIPPAIWPIAKTQLDNEGSG
jgi:hypothetical protein